MNGIGVWASKGQEGNSQEHKKSRCWVTRCLPCHIYRSFRFKKLSLVITLFLFYFFFSTSSLSKFFQVVKGEVKVFPESSRLIDFNSK